MNTISFMEILIESMAVVGQEYVGKYATQDADGTFNFFADRPFRKIASKDRWHWDSTMGPIASIKGVQLYSNWHGAWLSRVGYDNYVAYKLRRVNEDV